MKSLFIFNGLFSLVAGTLIYLLFRTSALNIFNWLEILNIDFINSSWRIFGRIYYNIFPDWFLFSLPDGLWIFSYTSIMFAFWDFKFDFQTFFWINILPIIAVFSEIGQFLKVVNGTFDFCDLLFYLSGFLLPFIILTKKLKIYEKN